MLRVFVLYALSGFISLAYQVCWFRIVTDWYGSTTLTFALVVCSFICGLGVGAVFSERASRLLESGLGLRDPLRVYGALEIIVGLTALLTVYAEFLPADLMGSFPYRLQDGIWVQSSAYRSYQLIVGISCVFIPCFFMGTTFPLLCRTFITAPRGHVFPSALYAWNTLGAVSGVLACQFLLIPVLGHKPSFWCMAALNVALGAYFVVSGGAPEGSAVASKHRTPDPPSDRSASYLALVVLAALSGLVAGSLEGDLFKRLDFALGELGSGSGATMSFISFWAILGIFLASVTVNLWPGLKLWHIKLGFGLAWVGCFVPWVFRYVIMKQFEAEHAFPDFPTTALRHWAFVGIYAFFPFYLVSLLLPWVCNRIQATGQHLGVAYGVNTLSFCAGLVVFTLVAPAVNIFYSLRLFFLFLLLAALLLAVSSATSAPRWRMAAFGVGLALVIWLTPAGFSTRFFYPETYPTRGAIRELRANSANTTFVVDTKAGLPFRLYFNAYSMSGVDLWAQTYMRLMAHVPLLAQQNPQKALLIGFGVGNTASAIALHQRIREIDVVDLNMNVFLTSPAFAYTSDNVHEDPRLRRINDDGRSYLRMTDEKYDLITSEPPPPLAPGIYRLYSREYYEDVLAALTPNGMMSQWLPMYHLPQEAADLMIRTFVSVFPKVMLYRGYSKKGMTDLLLFGGRSSIDMERVIQMVKQEPGVGADLWRLEIHDAADLPLRVVAEDAPLRRSYAVGRVISDGHNDLEHLYTAPGDRASYPPGRLRRR